MQKKTKNDLLQLLDSLQRAQVKLLGNLTSGERLELLQGCQAAAITIGETIEKEAAEQVLCVKDLEAYCEALFILSQEEQIKSDHIACLDGYLREVKASVEEIETKYRVVFLPYKAEMWDSLESIWLACKEDDRCECAVVPIPYFTYNSGKEEWEYQYDGNKFPKEVPIIPYQQYQISEMRPDVAYVHNPYDDCNYVTSVYPDYYSYELKKYVGKLVYVPYYVTPGWISDDHKDLSVYNHMDYMITQSEYAKERCDGLHFHNKMKVLGSPKFDKIIRQSQNRDCVDIPEEWKAVLKGKKVLFWNTSIGDLLKYGAVLFQKMYYAFNLIAGMENMAVIWRPHPLLISTMQSMRPELLDKFQALKQHFMESGIGVYDDTPQVTTAIVLADAYVDSGFSSVANLVGATGKPICILNNFYYEDVTKEQKRRLRFNCIARQNDKIWLTTAYNGLFYMDLEERQIHFADRIEGAGKWAGTGSCVCGTEDKLYLSPGALYRPMCYDNRNGQFQAMFQSDFMKMLGWGKNLVCGEHVFYFPGNDGLFVEYNILSGEWKFHTECIEALWQGIQKESWMSYTWDWAVHGGYIWCITVYTNRVMRFCIEEGSYEIYEIGSGDAAYVGIEVDENGMWLASTHSQELFHCTHDGQLIHAYDMIEVNRLWKNNKNISCAYFCLISMGNYLVLPPSVSDCMIKFDKRTGESKRLLEEFFENVGENHNGYIVGFYGSVSFMSGKLDDRFLLVQRSSDLMMAIVDIETETYELIDPALSEEEWTRFVGEDDGFEKVGKCGGFYRRESALFPLREFLEQVAEGELGYF